MAVYGDQLVYFPELFSTYNIYSMSPELVAGKKARTLVKKVRGVLQFVKGGDYKEEGQTLNSCDIPTFWSRVSIGIGLYVTDAKDESVTYIITGSNNYKKEGNFFVYRLETVVASTDRQVANTDVDYGKSRYE